LAQEKVCFILAHMTLSTFTSRQHALAFSTGGLYFPLTLLRLLPSGN
jgi:hypothetical protein